MAKKANTEKSEQTKKNKPAKAQKKGPTLGKRFIDYLKGVQLELKRVVWPSKEEVVNSSIIVVTTLIFFGLFTFVIDQIGSSLIRAIVKLGG